jgi:biotin synthase-related radical SAM superfamily protein
MEMEWNLVSFFIDNLDLSMLVWEVSGVIDITETEFQFQTYLSMECPICCKPYGWFLLNDWTRGLEILKFLGVQKQLASIFKIWTGYILQDL